MTNYMGGVRQELFRAAHRVECESSDRVPDLLGAINVGIHEINDTCCTGGRCLERPTCNLVGNARVDLMPNADEHGFRTTSNRRCNLERVVGEQIGARSATTHEHHDVDVVPARAMADRLHDRRHRTITLHTNVEGEDGKSDTGFSEFLLSITMCGTPE